MLSVITLTFNNYEELLQTLQSLEPVADKEVIVINGGSCERTKRLLATTSLVAVSISEKDRGIADAFNKGIGLSKGDALCFLNSGDRLNSPEYLKQAVARLRQNSEFGFIHGNMLLEDEIAGLISVRPPLCDVGWAQPFLFPTILWRRSVFDRVGLFDLSYKIAMDFEFILRVKKLGIEGSYLDDEEAVIMDGRGISNRRDLAAVKESFRALEATGLMTPKRYVLIMTRFARIYIKKILLYLNLSRFVRVYKKSKHGSLSAGKRN
jgi:glycosyltransferase